MIIIVGAGITGLALGELLKRKNIPFRIIEASQRPGGNMSSLQMGPYLIEEGPNSLQMNDQLFYWLTQLQLSEDVVYSLPAAKNRYILKSSKYQKLPKGPQSLLLNTSLSLQAKKRIINERRVKSLAPHNESIDAFFRRRFGDEITDYVVYPFVSGIYAGDPKQLMVKAAFPNLLKWEKSYGSLLVGMIKQRNDQVHKGIFSFQEGLQRLVDRLADKVSAEISFDQEVSRLYASDPMYLHMNKGKGIEGNKIVLTVPAYQAAKILQSSYPQIAKDIAKIYSPPVSVVYTAYKKQQIKHSLRGFGALHNQVERSNTLGTLFSSSVFPNRCPDGEVLLTTFVGGSLHPNWALAPEAEIKERVTEDHQRFLGVKGEPVFQHLRKWEKAIPQYTVDIYPAWEHEETLENHGIYLGGNWIGGISVVSCIRRAFYLANKLEAGVSNKVVEVK
ncbi:MAG: protoporphyrinogen oxidase [Bacteroidota bacterium]